MEAGSVKPLVVIVGPTASGKTSLAIEVASRVGGEIICADSRTVYKGMNIGTAKPTPEERARVPHWGLDLVDPGEPFSVSDFKRYAEEKIKEIRARGHIPFLVGGSGLYIDAVVFDYQFGAPPSEKQREKLNAMSLKQLYEYCQKNNIELPENKANKRYVVRAIEQKSINTKRRSEPISDCIIVGIATDRGTLRQRIQKRVEQLFDDGVVEEATLLGKKYGWDSEAMTGNTYQIVHSYLENEISLSEAKEKNTTLDWRLAKRQMTWFRRNPFVHWAELPEARKYLFARLANE
ncbi:MAG TPA: tRNA (adenosine(37)-N6)-dimethylallyltransferase MiaA [Candidatus Saccharimonadales bacterium]|nr:tRNA (adenosine(37)-N6)-dimethylallyltransferase MiaA [Candidatus Saccharimonadales bacterium]